MRSERHLETSDILSALRHASISGVSAVMRVEVVGDVGYVFLLDGEPAHASTLELTGEDAVRAILSWGSGNLAWCERRWPRERSVHLSWAELRARPEPDAFVPPAPVVQEPVAVEHGLSAEDVHLPSSLAIRRLLAHADSKSSLCLTHGGAIAHRVGGGRHLAEIVRGSLLLGDSLGAALGLGPLLAAEASAPGLHRLLVRSSEESSIVENGDGAGLELARAFLKL
jgi:hypothetical protein